MSSVDSSTCFFSYQSRGVLVRPEGLRDWPVTDGNASFGVGSHVDQLVTAMPRLQTGLPRLSWNIWTETFSEEEAASQVRQTEV